MMTAQSMLLKRPVSSTNDCHCHRPTPILRDATKLQLNLNKNFLIRLSVAKLFLRHPDHTFVFHEPTATMPFWCQHYCFSIVMLKIMTYALDRITATSIKNTKNNTRKKLTEKIRRRRNPTVFIDKITKQQQKISEKIGSCNYIEGHRNDRLGVIGISFHTIRKAKLMAER